MTNREFVAAYHGRYHAPGQAAARELLLTCPVCGTPNFSERGLRAHCCRAKPDRARLTPDELQRAQVRAMTPRAIFSP
jgi:hypothetical protein